MDNFGPETQPMAAFDLWMNEARRTPQIKEPTAMTLSTVRASDASSSTSSSSSSSTSPSPSSLQGHAPSSGLVRGVNSRVVLCKEWSPKGLVFFTNYNSRKGQDLTANPSAAAVFFWEALVRQVSFSGQVEKTSREVSEAYWSTRPRDSQLSQYISQQSRPVASRAALEQAQTEAELEFGARAIPCPQHWGGYTLVPERVEFWIGRPGRLHDRFEYLFEKSQKCWTFRRLYP